MVREVALGLTWDASCTGNNFLGEERISLFPQRAVFAADPQK